MFTIKVNHPRLVSRKRKDAHPPSQQFNWKAVPLSNYSACLTQNHPFSVVRKLIGVDAVNEAREVCQWWVPQAPIWRQVEDWSCGHGTKAIELYFDANELSSLVAL